MTDTKREEQCAECGQSPPDHLDACARPAPEPEERGVEEIVESAHLHEHLRLAAVYRLAAMVRERMRFADGLLTANKALAKQCNRLREVNEQLQQREEQP